MSGLTAAFLFVTIGGRQGMKSRKAGGTGCTIKDCKQRGEWAELCFMARAAGEGLKVSRPWGDTSSYDVGVEHGGRFMRVQVKSTIYRRRHGEYSLNVCGPKRQKYKKGTVDFFAVYLIPIDTWYIVPYEVMGETNFSLHFNEGSRRPKYARFREAWSLFQQAGRGTKTREGEASGNKPGVRIEAGAEISEVAEIRREVCGTGQLVECGDRREGEKTEGEKAEAIHRYVSMLEELRDHAMCAGVASLLGREDAGGEATWRRRRDARCPWRTRAGRRQCTRRHRQRGLSI
jgi:hypothetical protein